MKLDEYFSLLDKNTSANIVSPNMVKGYCMKCKEKREIKNAVFEKNKLGRPIARGTCTTCGTKMYAILSKEEGAKHGLHASKPAGKAGGSRHGSRSGGGKKASRGSRGGSKKKASKKASRGGKKKASRAKAGSRKSRGARKQ